MMPAKLFTAVLLGLILVSGCSTRFTPQQAQQIAIISHPVENRFIADNLPDFHDQFDDYLLQHKSMLLTHRVTIEWHEYMGRQMADYAMETLLNAGIDPASLSFRHKATSQPSMTIRHVYHSVQVAECTPYTSTPLEPMTGNCYVESSRYQSMVHPEKMLPADKVSMDPNDPEATFIME